MQIGESKDDVRGIIPAAAGKIRASGIEHLTAAHKYQCAGHALCAMRLNPVLDATLI